MTTKLYIGEVFDVLCSIFGIQFTCYDLTKYVNYYCAVQVAEYSSTNQIILGVFVVEEESNIPRKVNGLDIKTLIANNSKSGRRLTNSFSYIDEVSMSAFMSLETVLRNEYCRNSGYYIKNISNSDSYTVGTLNPQRIISLINSSEITGIKYFLKGKPYHCNVNPNLNLAAFILGKYFEDKFSIKSDVYEYKHLLNEALRTGLCEDYIFRATSINDFLGYFYKGCPGLKDFTNKTYVSIVDNVIENFDTEGENISFITYRNYKLFECVILNLYLEGVIDDEYFETEKFTKFLAGRDLCLFNYLGYISNKILYEGLTRHLSLNSIDDLFIHVKVNRLKNIIVKIIDTLDKTYSNRKRVPYSEIKSLYSLACLTLNARNAHYYYDQTSNIYEDQDMVDYFVENIGSLFTDEEKVKYKNICAKLIDTLNNNISKKDLKNKTQFVYMFFSSLLDLSKLDKVIKAYLFKDSDDGEKDFKYKNVLLESLMVKKGAVYTNIPAIIMYINIADESMFSESKEFIASSMINFIMANYTKNKDYEPMTNAINSIIKVDTCNPDSEVINKE